MLRYHCPKTTSHFIRQCDGDEHTGFAPFNPQIVSQIATKTRCELKGCLPQDLVEKLNAIASSYDFERRKSSLPTKKKRADWLKSVSGSLDRIVNNLPLDRQFEGVRLIPEPIFQ
ncbi:MAG: hypothetical protein HRU33_23615 [Rhodobacteraceae bacterium]|nr:hypothetical protein [Paracoccaceae bacterium]